MPKIEVTMELKKGFSQISNKLCLKESGLTNGELRIIIYIISKPPDWIFYTSKISEETGIFKDTVSKHIKELEVKGWISRKLVNGVHGGCIGANITLHNEPIELMEDEGTEKVTPPTPKNYGGVGVENTPRGGGQNYLHTNTKKTNRKESNKEKGFFKGIEVGLGIEEKISINKFLSEENLPEVVKILKKYSNHLNKEYMLDLWVCRNSLNNDTKEQWFTWLNNFLGRTKEIKTPEGWTFSRKDFFENSDMYRYVLKSGLKAPFALQKYKETQTA